MDCKNAYVANSTLLQKLKYILDIFTKATERLSGFSFHTLSAQFPSFSVLATHLQTIVHQERTLDSIFSDACTASWQKLDEYRSETNSAQVIATILDPRCNVQSFRKPGW